MPCKTHNLPASLASCIKSVVLCLLIIATCSPDLFGQRRKQINRFNAGLVFGLTASQIDGDHLQGYNKLGFYAGIRAIANLTKRDELVIEMQFNQKGSREPERIVPGSDKTRLISLNYIEVPILIHHKFDTEVGKVGLEGGIAFSKLIGTTINENANTSNYDAFSDILEDFDESDLAVVIGAGVYFSDHLRFAIRSSYALTQFYISENPVLDNPGDVQTINRLRNIQLTLGFNYNF